jgi:hypothetical protein
LKKFWASNAPAENFGDPHDAFRTLFGPLSRQVTLDCPCWYRWDLNGDGLVSIADYLELLAVYGQSVEGTPNAGLDVDGDGLIGMTELMDFLTQFGASCEANDEPNLDAKSVSVRR